MIYTVADFNSKSGHRAELHKAKSNLRIISEGQALGYLAIRLDNFGVVSAIDFLWILLVKCYNFRTLLIETQCEHVLGNPCCQHNNSEDIEKGDQHRAVSPLFPKVGIDVVKREH